MAWVSLDEGDDEPVTFFRYVIAALQTINARLGQSALELLNAPAIGNRRSRDVLRSVPARAYARFTTDAGAVTASTGR